MPRGRKRDRGTGSPQPGIFSMGTGSQLYLELDKLGRTGEQQLAKAIGGLREPRTTMAGVNLVVGFRPELWRRVSDGELPERVNGFNREIRGTEGFVMPATQHDAVLWFSGVSQDVVFDEARATLRALGRFVSVASETVGWPYRQDRDLTGFIDGSENPTLFEAPGIALVPRGHRGAGGSILLLQKWQHETERWDALSRPAQERVIGRTKPDSVEFRRKPRDSHAGKTDQDRFGKIFRRNVPYGGVTDHGTLFVGFCSSQRPLQEMLESMAGVGDGIRDALTRYTRPLTGAYYFVPSLEALRPEGSA